MINIFCKFSSFPYRHTRTWSPSSFLSNG